MRNKKMTAAQAAALIKDGDTIAMTGSGGGLVEPDFVFEAIEQRFKKGEGAKNLSLVHALGLGDRGERGTNRFAHAGMVKRVIGGHWTWSPRMQALARSNEMAAYSLPGGVITHLLREIGAGRPGLITHVGLGTFVDPRQGGGKMNPKAEEDLVEVLNLDGREYLRYKPFPINVGIIRGTYADTSGNISLEQEPADLDAYVVALAAHNSGGIVIAQVREIVPVGQLSPRSVAIPGVLVNAVVEAPEQMQTYRDKFDPSFVGKTGTYVRPPLSTDALKKIIARRAAQELRPGSVLNFGFGASAQVASLIAERGISDDYWTTVEQGIHGGHMREDDLFGMAHHPAVIINTPSQFDFYSGGGLDIAFLGMAEMDKDGNVNVSKLNGNVNGPGGFIDISQNAKMVVFCGTFDAKNSDILVEGGQLHVKKHGSIRKLVDEVAHITFSGKQAVSRGQRVVYVTERATFELTKEGVELIEVAPGVDVQKDVLAHMDFPPIVRAVRSYDAEVMQ